jgi:glycosyltransferase involved in cell wall biosynthesis
LRSEGFPNIAVLIPAWQPDQQLSELATSLLTFGFGAILIVNDGSGPLHAEVFAALANDSRIRIIPHAINLGKGRALKTGFNEFLTLYPDFAGVVTCDADGQHRPSDVASVALELQVTPNKLILGCRKFTGPVPARSRFGNTVTNYVFAILTGKKLTDTQCGLRGIPRSIIPRLMRLEGERYEYEMNVLADAAGSCGVVEVPIETVYLNGNRSSHFNPVLDSMRIYFVLMRFFLSSLISAGIDFLVFTAVFWLTHSLAASVVAGRVSSLANFFLNRKFVFSNQSNLFAALTKYYVLVAVMGVASYSGINFLSEVVGLHVLVAKLLVETLLWVVGFAIQRTFVFRSGEKL